MTHLTELGLTQAWNLLKQGEISSVDLVQACLAQIDSLDPGLQAWRWVDHEGALSQARLADDARRQGQLQGELHGLPVGVKDIIDTASGTTEYGSSLYAGHTSRADAACVSRARRSGAIVLGKTHTTEFAYFRPAPTHNPAAPGHTPGGSSSGSAAAVAAHMVPAAFGTQTAASVIRPAAFCGVVGYKSSWGAFSLAGIKPFAHSLDSLGFLARQVEDVQRLRSALLWTTPNPAHIATPPEADPRLLRLLLCQGPHWDQTQADSQQALHWAASALSAAGARVEKAALPAYFQDLTQAQKIIMAYEAAQSLSSEFHHHRSHLSPQICELIESGLNTPWSVYQQAQDLAHRCRQEFSRWLPQGHVVLTPSALGAAPKGLQATGDPLLSRMWTLLHVPSISLPGYRNLQGHPVGIQLVGAWGQDEELLRHSVSVEAVLRASP